jgi:Phosphoribosyl transferase domain
MPLRVFSCCTYSTLRRSRTQEQWAALYFVKAIKRQPLRGYASVPLPDGTVAHLDERTCAQAPSWFAQMAATRIPWAPGLRVLVPVPDAACGLSDDHVSKTVPLARALVAALPPGKATVRDVLRWAKAMPSTHQAGGTRDPQELYGRLRLAVPLSLDGSDVILIDDVMASGGHLRACAAFLRDGGANVVAAVCAGRADDTEPSNPSPFGPRSDVLPDFVSDPDWLLPAVYDGIEL